MTMTFVAGAAAGWGSDLRLTDLMSMFASTDDVVAEAEPAWN